MKRQEHHPRCRCEIENIHACILPLERIDFLQTYVSYIKSIQLGAAAQLLYHLQIFIAGRKLQHSYHLYSLHDARYGFFFIVVFAGFIVILAYSMMGRTLCARKPPFDCDSIEGSASSQQVSSSQIFEKLIKSSVHYSSSTVNEASSKITYHPRFYDTYIRVHEDKKLFGNRVKPILQPHIFSFCSLPAGAAFQLDILCRFMRGRIQDRTIDAMALRKACIIVYN